MAQFQFCLKHFFLYLLFLGSLCKPTQTTLCSDSDTTKTCSRESTDSSPLLQAINLLAPSNSYRLHEFMDVYRHVSTFDIKWDTNLISIPEASDQQIESLIERKSNYPKVQDALRLMKLGNSSYLEITVEDDQSDKYAHVILAYRRTESGMRRLVICEFRQCSHLNIGGLIETFIVSGVIGFINPPAGILCFTAKVAADYAISKYDVSVIVAIKELVHAGFLRLNETTMQVELPQYMYTK